MLVAPLISFIEFTSMAFVESPARPTSSQFYKYEKAADDSAEYAAARASVAVFFPNPDAAGAMVSLQPGNSGMWPFKVADGQQAYLLKVASADAPADVAQQAARARWAGAQGLGPVVYAENALHQAYITQFIEGSVLSQEQAATEKKAAIARALRRVHTADTHALATPTFKPGDKNWLFSQNLHKCLRSPADPRTALFADALVDLYGRVEKRLESMQYANTAVHDDIKADNAFAIGNEVIFVDWDNLKLADPMMDLAHFLWSIDAPVAAASAFLRDYYGADAAPSAEQDAALTRLQLRLFEVRLRSFAFFGQYDDNEAHTQIYQFLLKDDIAAVVPLL